ncbi:MAG: hypothetical protein CVU39_06675 [Chloroflexi bacterium HGW-Chloroflexi-10]|nr:MAG: hypothetical protein CVU39_06675 [Chloroflexi bacterium HGW-Chloroflexi-10]
MKTKRILVISLFLMLAFVLSSCTGGALQASSWPGINGDGENSYVSHASYVYSLRVKDGTENWRFPSKAEGAKTFFARPLVTDNQILVGDYVNTFYSINPASGVLNWEFTGAANRYIGAAAVGGDLILAPNADYNLYALDFSGNLVWTFKAKQALWSAPVVDGETVYLASMDHFLYALNLKTGEMIWETDLGGAIVYSPSMENGTLFVATLANEVVAVNKTNGSVVWRNPTSQNLWSQPVIKDGIVYYGDHEGKVSAVSAEDGKEKWNYNLGEMVSGAAAIMPDGVVFAGENGKLVGLDFNGELLWTRSTDGKLYTGPVLVDSMLVLGIVQGENLLKSYTFDGNEVWSYKPSK